MKTEQNINEDVKDTKQDTLNQEQEQTSKNETLIEEKSVPKTDAERLVEAEAKIVELQDKYIRQVAEFDNYRKRTLKEKAELILNGAEKTVISVLPILDDFERALSNMQKTDDVAAVKEGVELIFQKFIKTLEAQGVKKIETVDIDFNTDLHEAIAQIPATCEEMKGKVIDCVQTGYTLNEKVIRYAKVAVGV